MKAVGIALAPLVVAASLALGAPVSAGEPPQRDAEVRPDAGPEETGIATPPPGEVTASATATYKFGAQPLEQVLAAAHAREDVRCSLSAEGLAAMMVAPTFPETGAGSSAAPSPMTLSRWDTDRGLHSLSDPSRYPRVFWHPGIGMWQFDSAGGWGLTAYQRMDMRQISGVAADVMASRYCNAINAGQSGASARASAWGPWHACRSGACETIFGVVYRGRDVPLALEQVSGIEYAGGVFARTCQPPGLSARTCQHVDPARAQGYTGWRGSPDGTSSIAPLSLPFDVVSANGLEWRLWDADDTGYGVDIAASRPLGANARAKPDPEMPCARVSPLKWYVNGALVDSVDRSGCVGTSPPSHLVQSTFQINGTYEPVIGDFDGDGRDDIVWYRAGPGDDHLWRSPVADRSSTPLTVNGYYEPIVGDFDGDGRDDIFWYGPGRAPEAMWAGRSAAVPFRNVSVGSMPVNGVYEPFVGDFDGDGREDIFWFDDASATDHIWRGTTGPAFSSASHTLGLDAVDAIGDFDGDGRTDLLDHRPGPAADAFHYSTGTGFVRHDKAVNGSYSLTVGDFDGNGADDLHWYAVTGGADTIWFHEKGAAGRSTTPPGATADLPSGMRSVVVPHTRDEVLWIGSDSVGDQYWTFSGRSLTRASVTVDDGYVVQPGRWSSGGQGVLFHAPGAAVDAIWTR